VYGVNNVWQTDIRTTEPLVPQPNSAEIEIAVKKLTRYKLTSCYAFLHTVREMNAYRAGHVCLSIWFNLITTGQIWMKFGMDFKPLGNTLKPYFTIFYSQ
jgi:hypothetical protein